MRTLKCLLVFFCLLGTQARAQFSSFAEWESRIQSLFSESTRGPKLTLVVDLSRIPVEWDSQMQTVFESRPPECAGWRILVIPRATNAEGESTVERLKDILNFPPDSSMALLPPLEEIIRESARRSFTNADELKPIVLDPIVLDLKRNSVFRGERRWPMAPGETSVFKISAEHSARCEAGFKNAEKAQQRQIRSNFLWSRKY